MRLDNYKFWILILLVTSLTLFSCQTPNSSEANSKPSIYLQENKVTLGTPVINSNSILFEKSQEVSIEMDVADVEIYYTLDQSDPSRDDLNYTKPIRLEESTEIKARAFHAGYLTSKIIRRQFEKLGPIIPVAAIDINRAPHEDYQGVGAKGLVDRIKGTTNYKAESWMGFSGGNLEIKIELEQEIELRKVTCSLLSDPSAWIFLPKKIEVYTGPNWNDLIPAKYGELKQTDEGSTGELRFKTLSFDPALAKCLKIVVESHEEIPEWHPGKGTDPWLFIDEILFE